MLLYNKQTRAENPMRCVELKNTTGLTLEGGPLSDADRKTLKSLVTFVADAVNPKTRRVTVRCIVPNAGGRLKPEMYATVALAESGPRPIVAVPSQAVHEIDGRTVVFVQAGDRVTRREVRVGSDVDGLIEIRTGLKAGERVAAAGSFLLKSELLKQTMPEG